MAKKSSKKTTRKPQRMAHKQREFPLPIWIVVCVMLLLAGGLAAYVWWPASYYPEIPIEPEQPAWKAGPEDFEAYADTLMLQTKHVLISLGIPKEVIQITELPPNRGSYMRWETRSDVPGDLPLSMCNLSLTRLAKRLGGDVLEGREDQRGLMLSLRVGLGGKSTNLITLKTNDQLRRRTGRLAIVIDDVGYQDRDLIAGFCALPYQITLSIFPKEEQTFWAAEEAIKRGHGVMVHLPMEPIDYPARDPGPNAIFTDYAPERIQQLTQEALRAVPGARGVNNHMGSRATQNEDVMRVVLQEIKNQNLFFIDSITSPQSIAFAQAQASGVPSVRNTMFVDHDERTEVIVQRLYALADRARAEGTVVGICHAKPGTLKALQQVLPELAHEGFVFVLAEEAVK